MDSKDYKMIRFFRQLEKLIDAGEVKNIGIITDKDGTIMIDKELKNILKEIRTKSTKADIHIIANTGRTVADMIECLKKENIPLHYFDYIIGDNGATCLDVRKKQEIFKNRMNAEDVDKAIEEFLAIGGKEHNIRITDGEHIYAYDTDEVRNYYKKSKNVIYMNSFENLDGIDITKLTLAGTHDQITRVKKYIEQNIKRGKTHLGQTSFPKKQDNNYRMDFTGEHTKGTAAKFIKKRIGLDTCIYLGNDLNDISMFVEGIKDEDFIVIVDSADKKTAAVVKKYLDIECGERGKKLEEVKLLEVDEKDANKFLLKFHRILRNMERKNDTEQPMLNYPEMHKESNRESKQKIKVARKTSTNKKDRIR